MVGELFCVKIVLKIKPMLSGDAGKIVIQSIIFFERRPSLNDAILKENKKFWRVENSTFGFKKYSGASKNHPTQPKPP